MDEKNVNALAGAIVIGAVLLAIGVWLAGNAIGSGIKSGLRCQAVSNVVSASADEDLFSNDGGGAVRPTDC